MLDVATGDMVSVVVTFCCAVHPRSRANATTNSRVQILFMLNFNRLGRTLQRVFENARKINVETHENVTQDNVETRAKLSARNDLLAFRKKQASSVHNT